MTNQAILDRMAELGRERQERATTPKKTADDTHFTTVTQCGYIKIPAVLLERLGLKAGSRVELAIRTDKLNRLLEMNELLTVKPAGIPGGQP